MALSTTLVFNVKRKEPEMIKVPEKKPTWANEIKQLSDIDDQEILRNLLSAIFFYPPPPLGKKKMEPAKAIRDGLAKALVAYYPLAGRIFEEPNRKLMIDCNNQGVMFVKADANMKLDQLGHGVLPPCPYLEDLLCDVSGFGGIIGGPLLFLQVTRFLCGGFSLGIRFNHTVVDGSGLMQFLNAISEIVKGASAPSITPVWQRELLSARSPPKITCTHYEYNLLDSEDTKPLIHPEDTFTRTSILFGNTDIQTLRTQLPKTQNNNIPSPSKFDLITACLWKCRTIALEPNPNDIVRVSIAMDARQRKGINLPTGYYGNAFAYPAAVSKAAILCESPLAYAVDLVQRAKAQMNAEYMRSVADLLAIKGQPMCVTRWNFAVSDIRSLGFDKLDFGWGKPLFGGVPWATSVVSWYANCKSSNEEDGIVVSICLPSLALEKFRIELNKMTAQPISKIE